MPDPRFFEELGPVTLAELAALTGAELADRSAGPREVRGVSVMAGAGPDAITFVSDRKFLPQVRETKAGACFIGAADVGALPSSCAALIVASPQLGYALA